MDRTLKSALVVLGVGGAVAIGVALVGSEPVPGNAELAGLALPCGMPSPVQIAVDTYIRAWSERDSAVRARMLEACFAEDGRMVTRSREIRGRAGLAEEIARFLANPKVLRIRVTSAIDARGTTFRFRGVAEFRDGTTVEAFDAGEIDATGRISLLLTFAGPLGELDEPSTADPNPLPGAG